MLRARVPAPVAVDVSEVEGRSRCDRTAAARAGGKAAGDERGQSHPRGLVSLTVAAARTALARPERPHLGRRPVLAQ
jgi:hypothetical protein